MRHPNLCLNLAIGVALAVLTALPSAPAEGARRYVASGRIVPVFERLAGAVSAPPTGWAEVHGDAGALVMAYGDVIDADPSERADWLVLRRGPDGRETSGFVERKLMVPIPDYDPFPAQSWQARRDVSDLFLLPGALPLSAYDGLRMPRGTVASVSGRAVDSEGRAWLLCVFETDRSGAGPIAGSDRRCAWAPEEALTSLAATSPDLTQVAPEALPPGLSRDERKFLTHSGFYVDPDPILGPDGGGAAAPRRARFITADMALCAFRLSAGRAVQRVEERALLPLLHDFLRSLADAARRLPEDLSASEPGRTAAANVKDFIALAAYLATGGVTEVPPEVTDLAWGTMLGTGGLNRNPFTELSQDFAAFAPRGRYLLNNQMKAWFRTSRLLETAWPTDTETGAAAILILNRLMRTRDVQARWRALVAPLQYLRGATTPEDGVAAALEPFALADLKAPDRVKALISALAELDQGSGGPGRRFALLPLRPSFEARAFGFPTVPPEGAAEDPAPLPDPLEVMAALGSQPARDELSLFAGSRGSDQALRAAADLWAGYAAGREEDSFRTDALKCLSAYLTPAPTGKGPAQYFATQPAWGYKRLVTAEAALAELGSAAEAPAGGGVSTGRDPEGTWRPGPFAQPLPRGYVEPAPALYSALAEAADRLAAFVAPLLGGNPDPGVRGLTDFASEMRRLAGIAQRAIDDAMTYDDFYRIQHLRLPAEGTPTVVLAEAAASPAAGQALYVGTGTPRRLLVYVNDRSGGSRVTEGRTLSFYTFTRPLGAGMTEGKWQTLVRDGGRQDELKQCLPYWAGRLYE